MPDLANQAVTGATAVVATVIGVVIAELLRRSAERRADERATRDRLYSERRVLYPDLLRALRDAAKDRTLLDSSVKERKEALTLVGSLAVRRAVDELEREIRGRNRTMPKRRVRDPLKPVVEVRRPPSPEVRQRLADVERAMRCDLGVEE